MKGAIQAYSRFPSHIIVYSESPIRLYDELLKYKDVVISWDATGGSIIKQTESSQMLYYELSMTLPGVVSEDSIILMVW